MTAEEKINRLNLIRHIHRKLYIRKLTKGYPGPIKMYQADRTPNVCFICGHTCSCTRSYHMRCILVGIREGICARSIDEVILHWSTSIPKGSVSKETYDTSARDIHALLKMDYPQPIKFIKPIVDSW